MSNTQGLDTSFDEGSHERDTSQFFAWGGLQTSDFIEQNLCILFFGCCKLVLPGWSGLRNVVVELNTTIFGRVLHIPPLHPPLSDGFVYVQKEVGVGLSQ